MTRSKAVGLLSAVALITVFGLAAPASAEPPPTASASLAADCDGVVVVVRGGSTEAAVVVADTTSGAVLAEVTAPAGQAAVVPSIALTGAATRTIDVRVKGADTPLTTTAWPPAACATGAPEVGTELNLDCGGINLVLWNDGDAPGTVLIRRKVGTGDWQPVQVVPLWQGTTTSAPLMPNEIERATGRYAIEVSTARTKPQQAVWTPALCDRDKPEMPQKPVAVPAAKVVAVGCLAIGLDLTNTGRAGATFTVAFAGKKTVYQVEPDAVEHVTVPVRNGTERATVTVTADGMKPVEALWTPTACSVVRLPVADPEPSASAVPDAVPSASPTPAAPAAMDEAGKLPRTGAGLTGLLVAAVVALTVGGVLVSIARRRRIGLH